jgi:hypothetical protein
MMVIWLLPLVWGAKTDAQPLQLTRWEVEIGSMGRLGVDRAERQVHELIGGRDLHRKDPGRSANCGFCRIRQWA